MTVDESFLQRCTDPDDGFDVVVVVTSDAAGAAFWRQRLDATRADVLGAAELIVTIENWPGGAGNGLGTLHALQSADRELCARGTSLAQRLERGDSVGVWHTAGKGQRVYPLPLHHGLDKSRILVPGRVVVDGHERGMRMLEAVLRQTAPLAVPHRIGVFWGDQLVLPTRPMAPPETPVVLLGRLGSVPDAAAWASGGLDRYGLLAVRPDGGAMQLEKLSFDAFDALRTDLGPLTGAATSLGSFSMRADVYSRLAETFAPELAARRGRLDTDPGWWMPATLPTKLAHRLCGEAAVARVRDGLGGPLDLGVWDVGADAPWWDFGTLRSWHKSCLDVLRRPELRRLLGTPPLVHGSVCIDAGSVRARASVVVQAADATVSADGGVIMDCGPGAFEVSGVAYGLSSGRGVPRGTVACDDGQGGVVTAPVDVDGKACWSELLPGNITSFATLREAQLPEK